MYGEGWSALDPQRGDSCYYITGGHGRKYDKAIAHCEKKAGDYADDVSLVVVNDQDENDMLWGMYIDHAARRSKTLTRQGLLHYQIAYYLATQCSLQQCKI